MHSLKDMKLVTKLLCSFAVILGFILIVGTTAIVDLGRVAGNSDTITGHWMQSIQRLSQIDTSVANLRIQQLRIVTASTPEGVQSHTREANELLAEIARMRAAHVALVAGSEERALWAAYDQKWQDYADLHGRMLALVQEGKASAASSLVTDAGKRIYDDMRQRLEADLAFNRSSAAAATAESRQIYERARLLIVALAALSLLIGSIIALSMGRAIRQPLQQVNDVFNKMADGKLDNEVQTRRSDEMGQVLNGLHELQRRLRGLIAENHGQLDAIGKSQAVIEFGLDGTVLTANDNFLQAFGYSLDEVKGANHSKFVGQHEQSSEVFQRLWEKLRRGEYDKGRYLRYGRNQRKVWIDASYNPILDSEGKPYKVVKYANDVTAHVLANEAMEAAVAQTQEAIKLARDGDLTVRVAVGDKSGNLQAMAESINDLMQNMSDIVSKVKGVATEVHQGAEEISQGNTNLSHRTEQQAASLEETASSMEEMTATVRQNADNAAQANQLATAARDQAERGGSVTNQAVEAMAGINEASNRIAAIIGVIDELAFQTNLLALNAAVEAARAGEQGRGFAVVASEVRNLASRSAAAAKEIKDLIVDSVKRVEDGSSLVTQSGQSLEQIVMSVKKVCDIVAEIAAASREQSTGIEQVNRAVSQMDEMTQQNAALVEQAAAASQSMATQARELTSLMTSYRVSGDSGVTGGSSMPAATVTTLQPRRRRAG